MLSSTTFLCMTCLVLYTIFVTYFVYTSFSNNVKVGSSFEFCSVHIIWYGAVILKRSAGLVDYGSGAEGKQGHGVCGGERLMLVTDAI